MHLSGFVSEGLFIYGWIVLCFVCLLDLRRYVYIFLLWYQKCCFNYSLLWLSNLFAFIFILTSQIPFQRKRKTKSRALCSTYMHGYKAEIYAIFS